ncbi:serine hydrolase domain-containing protein [Ornithinibacillus halophilus]|uniref:CubicO group peptidase, beta-lactamase class C family n=1 Tax=Ornithinibacillus halophilus TaxID=930117 RepID=A0A1M5N528_9BACI|nr:serine hydrolase domain-containing protein [Ornithinibacillus halophilus]SHG84289.1 CubicO group peptidase, beta-lactamase class C family [Ornithinibacillus halophilus]
MKNNIVNVMKKNQFSGTALVRNHEDIIAEGSHGYANRSEQLPNKENTRFGIASGCKIFTSVAICQLVEEGKLTFDTKLIDILDDNFPNFDRSITIHHLLTHTSGVPDYFDEEVMDDFEELWKNTPMYHIRKLQDFLPLFQNEPMKFNPGELFHYNNGGYILLGLVVEKLAGVTFTEYVINNVFEKAGMNDSGYFALDALPANTAHGYIENSDGTWRTNIYSLPVQGGSDGGAFVTTEDMLKFWDALLKNKLLSEEMTKLLLTPHVHEDGNEFYGYGVWISKKENGDILRYHVMGYDPGVCFHSVYYPEYSIKLAVCGNISEGAFDLVEFIEEELL